MDFAFGLQSIFTHGFDALAPSASAALCGLLLPSAVASAFCFCRPLLLLPSASAALCGCFFCFFCFFGFVLCFCVLCFCVFFCVGMYAARSGSQDDQLPFEDLMQIKKKTSQLCTPRVGSEMFFLFFLFFFGFVLCFCVLCFCVFC